jgi:predicted DCC family thiol-disulfide oxidoreductase YuxK
MKGEPYIVFYDGHCRLCRRGRQTIERLRPAADLRFVDVNDARALAAYPALAGADVLGQMYVLDPAGRLSGGYDALVALAPAMPLFAWMSPLLSLRPLRAVGRRLYRWVAANRYRLGGQRPCHAGACALNAASGRA